MSALVSGATAILISSWIVPSILPSGQSVYMVGRTVDGEAIPDPRFQFMVEERIIEIYDTRKKVDDTFYPVTSHIASAMTLSSDGWAVAHIPSYTPGQELHWEGVGQNGQTLSIEQVTVNPIQELVYIKFSGTGRPFTLFAEWRSVSNGTGVWTISSTGQWQTDMLLGPEKRSAESSLSLWVPHYAYRLISSYPAGTLVITEAGNFIGTVDTQGFVIDAFFTFEKRGNIFSGEAISYESLPVRGTLVDGFVGSEALNEVSGFLVESFETKATSSLQVGDVIVRIQDERLQDTWLWRQLLVAPETVELTIIRDGEMERVGVKKQNIAF